MLTRQRASSACVDPKWCVVIEHPSGMSQVTKPLPALYAVYVLWSTVRYASLYIGSTPNPPRRLKQHNGEIKGGAARTSRPKLRPWEMIVVISGFPSMVAALKFEWALTNPHLSLHIPQESRLTVAKQKKLNGRPMRPKKSLMSIISNLHLLSGVASFSRWPLNLHFYDPEAYAAWETWLEKSQVSCRPGLVIFKDFGVPTRRFRVAHDEATGIDALPRDYQPIKDYVRKTHDVVSFEWECRCVHCDENIEHRRGLHAMCPREGCTAMGHLDCWSRHALSGDDDGNVMPESCTCPSCGGDIRWVDMIKELSLRIRGPKEVQRLLKEKEADDEDESEENQDGKRETKNRNQTKEDDKDKKEKAKEKKGKEKEKTKDKEKAKQKEKKTKLPT